MSAASLVLFVLIGAGHVLPALHFALVAHRLCAEHGELVHEVAPAPAPDSKATGPALVAAAGGHEHEHCGVPAVPATGVATIPASRCAARAPAALQAAVAEGERPAHLAVALLAYAPKLAPPAPAA